VARRHSRKRTVLSSRAAEEGKDRKDQKDDEENLCNACGGAGNAAETQYGGDDRDNQKNQCIVKHGVVLLNGSQSQARGSPPRWLAGWGSAIHP
jgi:hypothetical protein